MNDNMAEEPSPESLRMGPLASVDNHRAGRAVWLVRVPTEIAEAWENADERTTLGTLDISSGGSLKCNFTVDPAFSRSNPDFPQQCDINFSKPSNLTMFVEKEASNSEEPSTVSWNGTIQQRGELKVAGDDYRRFVRERTQRGEAHERTAILLADEHNNKRMSFIPKANIRERGSLYDKKGRMEKEQLTQLVCHYFEKKPYWLLRDLIRETNQPKAWLKDVVAELCIYNKSGPNKSQYSLKPEYRRFSIEETEAAAAAASGSVPQ